MIEVPDDFKVSPAEPGAEQAHEPEIQAIPVFGESSAATIEVHAESHHARLGSPAVREVVVLESHPNPTRVIGHPSNPVTNQAEAYANLLRGDE